MLTNFYNVWHIIYRANLQHNNYWFSYLLLHYHQENKFQADIYQQDGAALARRARQVIELLQRETSKFVSADLRPQNSADLNPVEYHLWGVIQDRVYQMPVKDVADLRQLLIDARCKALSTVLSTNDIRDFRPVWVKKEASWTLAVIFRLKCRRSLCTNWIFFYFVRR